jgi:hypothetical protein
MPIKNDMEFHVKSEAQRHRERPRQGSDPCWCTLCEIDIIAFALNRLPPRYCHERNFGCTSLEQLGDEVRSAVSRAVDKVSRRPKHRPGRPPADTDGIRLENFAQKIGASLVGTIMSPGSAACTCDQCQADALAYALNRYPPKYGVSHGGRESYQANFEDFIRHEIGQALVQAMAVVRVRPHH